MLEEKEEEGGGGKKKEDGNETKRRTEMKDCLPLCATLLLLSFFSVIHATHAYLDIQRVVLELGNVRNHVALGHARALQEGGEFVRITL